MKLRALRVEEIPLHAKVRMFASSIDKNKEWTIDGVCPKFGVIGCPAIIMREVENYVKLRHEFLSDLKTCILDLRYSTDDGKTWNRFEKIDNTMVQHYILEDLDSD